VTSYTLAV